ncbi:MAG: hypothetical protein K2W96_08200 [Gemmataceae bacterium]|nr:hypothetical protein [Gemmataceae bacterium]
MPDNLWPEFTVAAKPRTLRTVLLEAGNGIAERMGGKLLFDVASSLDTAGKRFFHTCHLRAATGSRFPLFQVVEQGAPYPVVINGDAEFDHGVKAANEADLLEQLRRLFAADPTKRVVFQMLDTAA